jgi:8-oxo-dGTP diphosphatase
MDGQLPGGTDEVMKERNKAVPAVYVILKNEKGEILMGRRCNTGYEDGNYTIPSGHVEAAEGPINAIIREAKEEVGITLKAEDLKFVHFLYREKQDSTGDRVDIFYEASKWEGEIINPEPDKCDDLSWFPITNLPANTIFHVKKVIECVQKGIPYSELNGRNEFLTH